MNLDRYYFEEVIIPPYVVIRRGRCDNWFSKKVGKNSDCITLGPKHEYCKIVNEKHKELFDALFYCVGSRNVKDFAPVEASSTDNYLESGAMERCFCTMVIKYHCLIRYIPDNKILLVGSCCVKKFFGNEFYSLVRGKKCKTKECQSRLTRLEAIKRFCSSCREEQEQKQKQEQERKQKQEIKLKSKQVIPISKIKMPKKEQTKEYTVSGNTLIGWGKLKGKPHSSFLQRENENYKNWVLNQGDEFRYANTRDWILKQNHGKEPNNIQITANEKQDAEVWKEIKRKLEEVLNDYPEFNLTFEF